MANPVQTLIRCTSCGSQFPANVRMIIDVSEDPQAKMLLLAGQLNNFQCPQCQNRNIVTTPLLYHDASKELLIALVPMELSLSKDQQEKQIGDLLNRLPKNNFRGYMFNPRRAITMQGMVEQILEADGITPDMMKEQRRKIELAQKLIEARSPEELDSLIQQHDVDIDAHLLQAMTLMAQRIAQGGRQDIAEAILIKQSIVAEKSSYGQKLIAQQQAQQQVVEEVAQEIEALGDKAQRADFLNLAVLYASDDERLQALVGLARPVFDYEFFQEMTAKIGQAPANQRDSLQALRQRIVDLTTAMDQQQQQILQSSARFLQTALQAEDTESFLRENLPMIDDTFMAVLSANIQHAEQQGNAQAATRLKQMYEMVVQILRDNMQPELRFVNELLSEKNESAASAMIAEQAKEFGDGLIDVMDAVEEVLIAQGDEPLVQRLKSLRSEAKEVLKAYD